MMNFENELWKTRHWFVCPQYAFIFDEHHQQNVDFIGKYENLQSDFDHVCHQLNIAPLTLPHSNKSQLDESNHFSTYQAYYDDASKSIVEQLYEQDIALFDYQF